MQDERKKKPERERKQLPRVMKVFSVRLIITISLNQSCQSNLTDFTCFSYPEPEPNYRYKLCLMIENR